jgi:DNA polymerase III subunit gamma/tau
MAKPKAHSNPAPKTAPPAEYTVVARRYRPQQFADLVGQEPVAQALTNAITTDRVAHAYLFTGPRGVGKTSAARILAKALNCIKGPTPTPCDECEICQRIASGEDIDVLEIDGASNRRIEEVREIRQNVNTRPTRSRYKIYIIDEVHMLTREAFNALLKTLEEPPPHVKFFFATTEYEKVPLTIRSRCQRFDFSGINSSKIVERLKQIVAAEGMEADDDALAMIARRGGGSMRDAQSLLDQVLAFAGERLTVDKLHQLLGTATDDRVLALVDAMVAKDARKAFELLGKYAEEGLQLGELLDQLIEYWRSLMVLNCAGADFADLSITEANRRKACQHAENLPLDSILAGLDILTTSKSRMRGSNHGLVLVEMAVLRLMRLDELVPVAQLVQRLTQPGATVPSAPKSAVSGADGGKKNSIVSAVPINGKSSSAGGPSPSSDSSPIVRIPAGDDLDIAVIWPKVREDVGPMLGGQLAAAQFPAIFGPNTLVLRFGLEYNHQHDYCSEPESIKRIEKSLREITGKNWNVRVDWVTTVEPATPKSIPEQLPAKAVTYRQREQDLARIPLVNRAIEKMGARLLKFDEGFGSSESNSSDGDAAEPQEP